MHTDEPNVIRIRLDSMTHFWISVVFLFCATRVAFAEVSPGDIVFQTSKSSQSRPIQLAMHSPYSHMGIVFFKHGLPYVFEASKTVQFTPLREWIARGTNGRFRAKRLKDKTLFGSKGIQKLEESAETFFGKPYDPYFQWSDDRIYCSELVWKIYKEALGLEIGALEALQDFDLSHPEVRAMLKKRFGENIPLTEKVISPASMFKSALLEDAE